MSATTLRERLPSAAAAIALQGGLLALLVLSFDVVRRVVPEEERIITLPPLAPPQAQRAPMVIDGRGRPASKQASPGPRMPAYVQPSFNIPAPSTAITPPSAAPLETRRGRAACETNYASLSPAERQRCPPPPPAQIDDAMRLLNPPSHVKDEAYWAEEKTRSDGSLPGTSFDTHSTHITLFKSDGPSILGGYRTPDAAPTHAHSSDADFQKALAATQARTRALYGRAPDATNKRAAP